MVSKDKNAYVHKDTKNKDFIRFAAMLQDVNTYNGLGDMILGLNNVELKSIDFNKKREKEESFRFWQAINKEAADNIWFYFRELVRIPDNFSNDPDQGLRFRLNETIYKMIFCYDNNIPFIINHETCTDVGTRYCLLLLLIYDVKYKNRNSRWVEISNLGDIATNEHSRIDIYLEKLNKLIKTNKYYLRDWSLLLKDEFDRVDLAYSTDPNKIKKINFGLRNSKQILDILSNHQTFIKDKGEIIDLDFEFDKEDTIYKFLISCNIDNLRKKETAISKNVSSLEKFHNNANFYLVLTDTYHIFPNSFYTFF